MLLSDRFTWLDTALQDLRYSLRGMRRNPAFTSIAVITLALTTAALATVLNLANAFLFRPLPADHPDELVRISATRRGGNREAPVSWPDYVHLRDHTTTLQGIAAFYPTAPLFVAVGTNAQEINGSVVSANYFPLLGIHPALGRFFRLEEDLVPGRDRVAVISFGLWNRWFGGSPDALGATVKVNGTLLTVIGVTPASFRGSISAPSEIYIPTMMMRVGYRWCDDSLAEDCTILSMTGRLNPGRTVAEAGAEMATLVPPRWEHAPSDENSGLLVRGERGADRSISTQLLLRVLLLVGMLLLAVSCANLAGMSLARATANSRESAVRISLGAGRFRILRQFLTDSVLVALLGGIGGILLSFAVTGALRKMFFSLDDEGHPLYFDFHIEPWIVGTVLAISVVAGVAFGILPAWRAAASGPLESLKGQSSAVSARSSLGQWLVGAQGAVAVALAAVSGLLIGSVHTLASGIHFEPTHVALMRLRPRLIQYTPAGAQKFQREAIARLERVPGVESASMVGHGIVLNGSGESIMVALPGAPDAKVGNCGLEDIGPRYFQTLRIPLLRGREFDDRDSAGSPLAAIVSRDLADRLWPKGNALGAVLLVNRTARQVVGIVDDVPFASRSETVKPFVYVPYWQEPAEVDARLCVRVHGDPASMLPRLAREVNRVDPDVPIAETITLATQLEGSFRPLRVTAAFLSYACGLTLLLSAIGLYGALSFAVARRTKEIGIRMAIGAEARTVLSLIVREGMTVVLGGVCAGVVLGAVGARLVRHLIFGSSGGDVVFYTAAALAVGCAGFFACWFPARRAAAIEPISALRQD